jgi:LacI family transcriptional regulator
MSWQEKKKPGPRPMGLNMREIARQLGVSSASVARALNNQPGVSDEMRRRIQVFAQEHDYQLRAHHAPSKETASDGAVVIAFLLHWQNEGIMHDPFYPSILQGVELEATALGHHVIVRSTTSQEEQQGLQLPLFRDHLATASILAGPAIDPLLVTDLFHARIPCVLVDNAIASVKVDSIEADNVSGTFALTQHLLEHGYHDIVMIHGPLSWTSVEDRVLGYRKAMWSAGFSPRTLMMEQTTIDDGERAMQHLLAEGTLPRAIVASNDAMALGAMQVARAQGLSIPEQIAFGGYDDIPEAHFAGTSLTTVRIHTEQMGREAARRLFTLLQQAPVDLREYVPTRTLLRNELILRASCGCVESG